MPLHIVYQSTRRGLPVHTMSPEIVYQPTLLVYHVRGLPVHIMPLHIVYQSTVRGLPCSPLDKSSTSPHHVTRGRLPVHSTSPLHVVYQSTPCHSRSSTSPHHVTRGRLPVHSTSPLHVVYQSTPCHSRSSTSPLYQSTLRDSELHVDDAERARSATFARHSSSLLYYRARRMNLCRTQNIELHQLRGSTSAGYSAPTSPLMHAAHRSC